MTPTPDQWHEVIKAAYNGRRGVLALLDFVEENGLPDEFRFVVCEALRHRPSAPTPRDYQLARAIIDHWTEARRIGERGAFESVRSNPAFEIDEDRTLTNAINGTREGIKIAFEEMTGAPWKSPREWRASLSA